MASRYRRRFEKRGFEASQRQLLHGLVQAGIRNRSVLEIGSGVGHLHQTLLEQGAASAQGVDLAAAMIEEATQWAAERGLDARVTYQVGDFVTMADQIDTADICVLDKVVCCYPDAHALVEASLLKTGQVLALTYPRDRWYIRAGAGLFAILLRLFGSAFRPYVHSPLAVEQQVRAAGLHKVYEARTLIWLTQVYQR